MKRIPATNKTKLKKRRSEENVRAALENANAPPVITRKRSGSGGDSKGLKRRRSEKKRESLGWYCPQCTFLNHLRSPKCDMCSCENAPPTKLNNIIDTLHTDDDDVLIDSIDLSDNDDAIVSPHGGMIKTVSFFGSDSDKPVLRVKETTNKRNEKILIVQTSRQDTMELIKALIKDPTVRRVTEVSTDDTDRKKIDLSGLQDLSDSDNPLSIP
eukprot:UN22441